MTGIADPFPRPSKRCGSSAFEGRAPIDAAGRVNSSFVRLAYPRPGCPSADATGADGG